MASTQTFICADDRHGFAIMVLLDDETAKPEVNTNTLEAAIVVIVNLLAHVKNYFLLLRC